MSVAKRKSEHSKSGSELFMLDGRKRDDTVHYAIIAEGDQATANAIGRKQARAAGLTPEEMQALFGEE